MQHSTSLRIFEAPTNTTKCDENNAERMKIERERELEEDESTKANNITSK